MPARRRERPLSKGRRIRGLPGVLCAIAFGLLAAGPWIDGDEGEALAKTPPARGKGTFENGCRVQAPQTFLERRAFVKKGIVDPKKHARALRYFVEHYGNDGEPATQSMNSQSAASQAKGVKLFGMPISVSSKIAPALVCVEKRIKKTCTGKSAYRPKAVGGLRTTNTYRGGEVSNHLFGIAIDIDPEKNPCCGCVDPWPDNPICKDAGKSAYERAALPKCWIKAFERYGFDWLGHDELVDTMHFEFLGDPDRITR